MTGFKQTRLQAMLDALVGAGSQGMTKKQFREMLNLKTDGGLKSYFDELTSRNLMVVELRQDPFNGRIRNVYFSQDGYKKFHGLDTEIPD